MKNKNYKKPSKLDWELSELVADKVEKRVYDNQNPANIKV